MNKILQYCQILGVSPGDSPEKVKMAFREKIKHYHPDKGGDAEKARLILEAYENLKNGVPQVIDRNEEPDRKKEKEEEHYTSREILREFLSRVFSSDPYILKIINEVLDRYGIDTWPHPYRAKRYYKQEDRYYPDVALERFETLEMQFHRIMQKFNSQKERPVKYRALELIQDLTQLKISYRSLMMQYPSLAFKCQNRLEKIKEIVEYAKLVI